jgi:hypothetical protein
VTDDVKAIHGKGITVHEHSDRQNGEDGDGAGVMISILVLSGITPRWLWLTYCCHHSTSGVGAALSARL